MKTLLRFESAGFLSVLNVELARSLCRIGGETDEDVALAIALTSRNVEQGHTCLDPDQDAPRLNDEAREAGVELPPLRNLRDALLRSALTRTPDAPDHRRPLVVDAGGRIYLARYEDHEARVAQHLVSLAKAQVAPPVLPSDELARLWPKAAAGSLDLQREAALSAREQQLSVIVGGPGTGKTSAVVKLLALLALDRKTVGAPLPRVLLVAPTGKAAQRLTESIESARDKLNVPSDVVTWLKSRAQTVHRALGSIDGSLTEFRHGPTRPLSCDVLLLDEASMVDLALMRRLLDALPKGARVIMLGDPDQLASVEAGGVLYDICRSAEAGGELAPNVTRLLQSHRYGSESGIANLAEAVRTEDAETALSLLGGGEFPDIGLVTASFERGVPRELIHEAERGYSGLQSKTLSDKLSALDRFRVLCAHRKGLEGAETLNLEFTRALRGHAMRRSEHYAGRPFIITQNDYATGLFNGDVGTMHAEGRGELFAYLAAKDQPRRLSLGRLPAHQTVYAMTVHKSQGSEFDRIALVLPARLSPVLTRELLFTGITRARKGLTIYASTDVLRRAIGQRVHRTSGLAARLSRC